MKGGREVRRLTGRLSEGENGGIKREGMEAGGDGVKRGLEE